MLSRRETALLSVACAMALLATACGSDDEAGGGGGGAVAGENGGTLEIGLVNSASGPASVGAAGLRVGVDARFAAYEDEGGACADELDFDIVEVDEQSSPQGNLAAVQRLVQQDEVYAILQSSSVFSGGIGFMTAQGANTPVLGYALDGPNPQWLEFDNNLFSVLPLPLPDVAYSVYGDYLDGEGATKVAGVAYNLASSQAGLENLLVSAEAAGLSRGYENTSVQPGSTDVGPIVLGVLDSGSDAVVLAIGPDTGFAVIAGLRQAGWEGTVMLSAGYGGELLQSAPAVQLAQGVTFSNFYAPAELGTEATTRLVEALTEVGSESTIPSFYEAVGWLSADAFLYGLDAAGCGASQQEFMDTLREQTDYDADGLLPQTTSFTTAEYDEQCTFLVKLEGDGFVPVEDASPLCGEQLD